MGPMEGIKVVEMGSRRGPATEAQGLYEDLSPPQTRSRVVKPADRLAATREKGSGRPTKKQRREIDALMDRGA